jgi:hypothetical protein
MVSQPSALRPEAWRSASARALELVPSIPLGPHELFERLTVQLPQTETSAGVTVGTGDGDNHGTDLRLNRERVVGGDASEHTHAPVDLERDLRTIEKDWHWEPPVLTDSVHPEHKLSGEMRFLDAMMWVALLRLHCHTGPLRTDHEADRHAAWTVSEP